MMDTKIKRLQEIINESHQIVFFGGAGVSTESGIPDFRSAEGIYHQNYKYPPEEVVSHSFFMRNPECFYEFYKDKMLNLNARPNRAHAKLAALEWAGKVSAVITQNIDGLHQAAGSKKVYELHGSVHRNYCMKCHKLYDAKYVKDSKGVPYCTCGGMIKPDVVLYEEALNDKARQQATNMISQADTLIIGGTSLSVYPAAGFIDYFIGKNLVLINKSMTTKTIRTILHIEDPIAEVFSQIKV